jgi:hypothetical protein
MSSVDSELKCLFKPAKHAYFLFWDVYSSMAKKIWLFSVYNGGGGGVRELRQMIICRKVPF